MLSLHHMCSIIAVILGQAPYNFICVQAGCILSDLKSWDDIFSTSTMLKLFSMALLPLAYAIFIRPQSSSSRIAWLLKSADIKYV